MRVPRRFLPFSVSDTLRGPPGSVAAAFRRLKFVGVFLLLAWPAFLVLVRGDGWIPSAVQHEIGFFLGRFETDAARAVVVSHIGIVVQHSWPQIIYVTTLLLTAGVAYESREGTLRTLLVFYGACLAGVAALTLVVLLEPIHGQAALAEHVGRVSWSGASVGCFGILGALVATARNPWPILGVWLAVEFFIESQMLPELALIMHMVGFLFGYTASRLAHQPASTGSADELPSPVTHPDDR
jgi:hypothetical protein